MAYDKEYGDATVDFGSVFDSYDGEVTNDSFNATSGCPMCGTYLYRRGVNQVPKRRIFSEPVRHGRNFDRGEYKDDAYIKCSKCGFICNTQRDQYAPEGSRVGWGVKYEEVEAG